MNLHFLSGWITHIRAFASPRKLPIHVLAIAPGAENVPVLTLAANRNHWRLTVVDDFAKAMQAVGQSGAAPVVICSRDLPGQPWTESIGLLAAKCPGAPVFLSSAVNDDYLWKEVVRVGGYDVLPSPFNQAEVERSIHRASTFAQLKNRI